MVKSSFKITNTYNNIVINGVINGKPYKNIFQGKALKNIFSFETFGSLRDPKVSNKKVFNTTFRRVKDFYFKPFGLKNFETLGPQWGPNVSNMYSLKHNLIKCKRYSEHHPVYGYYHENFRKTNKGYKRTLKHFNKYSGYKYKTELINENEYFYKVLYKKNHKLQFIKQIEYVYENGNLIKIRKYNNGNLVKEYII